MRKNFNEVYAPNKNHGYFGAELVAFDETATFTKEEDKLINERFNNIQTNVETEKLLEENEK